LTHDYGQTLPQGTNILRFTVLQVQHQPQLLQTPIDPHNPNNIIWGMMDFSNRDTRRELLNRSVMRGLQTRIMHMVLMVLQKSDRLT
jgi:hypothetical protein